MNKPVDENGTVEEATFTEFTQDNNSARSQDLNSCTEVRSKVDLSWSKVVPLVVALGRSSVQNQEQ